MSWLRELAWSKRSVSLRNDYLGGRDPCPCGMTTPSPTSDWFSGLVREVNHVASIDLRGDWILSICFWFFHAKDLPRDFRCSKAVTENARISCVRIGDQEWLAWEGLTRRGFSVLWLFVLQCWFRMHFLLRGTWRVRLRPRSVFGSRGFLGSSLIPVQKNWLSDLVFGSSFFWVV